MLNWLAQVGLTQASQAWNGTLDSHLTFGLPTIIVDDIIGTYGGLGHIRKTSQSLHLECKMFYMGLLY